MGLDAEEDLTHDDEHRDVEDEVRGQIVEIQAVVEHEPPDKWVKRKAQSVEEMGEKYDPLMGPRGGDELPLIWKPVHNVVRQVSGLPQLFDVPLPLRTWALELECAEMDKQRRKKA